jgi:hypothetical protein
MKKAAIKAIGIYRNYLNIFLKLFLGTNHFCRYNPTCSDYAKQVLVQYGFWKGSLLAIVRILSCQPIQFSSFRVKIKNYLAKAIAE